MYSFVSESSSEASYNKTLPICKHCAHKWVTSFETKNLPGAINPDVRHQLQQLPR
jgi:hypothetical protein